MNYLITVAFSNLLLIFLYQTTALDVNETQNDLQPLSDDIQPLLAISPEMVKGIVDKAMGLIGAAMKIKDKLKDDPVNMKLEEIVGILMQIDKKLDKLIEIINDQHILNEYNNYVHQIVILNISIANYAKNPTPINEKDLKRDCDKYQVENFITWIFVQMSPDTPGNKFYNIITRDMDPLIIHQWDNLIFTRMSQAILAYVTCFPFVHSTESEEDIQNTLFGTNGQNNGKVHTYEEYLNSINSTFTENYKKIDDFSKDWKVQVMNKWNENTSPQPQVFVDNLFHYLTNKYPFACWLTALSKSRAKGKDFRYTFGPFDNQTMIKDTSKTTKKQEILAMFRYQRLCKIDPIENNFIEKCIKKVGDYPTPEEAQRDCPYLTVYAYIHDPAGMYSKMTPDSTFEKVVYKKAFHMFGYGTVEEDN